MTPSERNNPELIEKSASRRLRIAKGAGMDVSELNKLRQSLKQQSEIMKQMNKMSESDLKKASKNPSKFAPRPTTKAKKGKGKGKGGFRIG